MKFLFKTKHQNCLRVEFPKTLSKYTTDYGIFQLQTLNITKYGAKSFDVLILNKIAYGKTHIKHTDVYLKKIHVNASLTMIHIISKINRPNYYKNQNLTNFKNR